MAEKTVRVEAKPDKKVSAYWVSIDDQDVEIENGVGEVTFDAGETAVLVWWLTGRSGATLSLVVKDTNGKILVQRNSSIPDRDNRHANYKRFKPWGQT